MPRHCVLDFATFPFLFLSKSSFIARMCESIRMGSATQVDAITMGPLFYCLRRRYEHCKHNASVVIGNVTFERPPHNEHRPAKSTFPSFTFERPRS